MIYLTLLLLILAISYVGLLLFYAWAFQKIPTFNTQLYPQQLPPITVIVPARNEAANIITCLNSIAQQQYPAHKLHLIVIDDHSTDNTPQLVDRFIAQNPQLNAQLLLLAQHLSPKTHLNSYKKKALEVAIAHARCLRSTRFQPGLHLFGRQQMRSQGHDHSANVLQGRPPDY